MSRIFTMCEAARELRKSRRWLQGWLAHNPVDAYGRPFFSVLGRSKVFRQVDIDRILDANMSVPCPSKSSPRAKVNRRIGRSAAPTSASLWTEAQELLKGPSQSSSERNSRTKSNVVSIHQNQSDETLQPS